MFILILLIIDKRWKDATIYFVLAKGALIKMPAILKIMQTVLTFSLVNWATYLRIEYEINDLFKTDNYKILEDDYRGFIQEIKEFLSIGLYMLIPIWPLRKLYPALMWDSYFNRYVREEYTRRKIDYFFSAKIVSILENDKKEKKDSKKTNKNNDYEIKEDIIALLEEEKERLLKFKEECNNQNENNPNNKTKIK